MAAAQAATGAERSSAFRSLATAGTLIALFAGLPAAAEQSESVPLRQDVRQKLSAIQESWIEWLAAVQEGDAERARHQIQALVSSSQAVGLPRLPELSVAAATRAELFAKAGDFEGADLSLSAAEVLDAGRSETAFSHATVDGLRGKRMLGALWTLLGCWRALAHPLYRYVFIGDCLLWLLAIVTLLAAGVVATQWATKGVLLFRDLVRFFGRSVPVVLAYVLALLLLLWPVLLPAGLLWLALYWSVLAWAYLERWEKLTIIMVWVLMSLAPLLVSEQIRRMNLDTIASVRAMTNVTQGRLVGSLFQDLAPLTEQLPDSVAVRHFMADLHMGLHQWELARNLYKEVIAAEPNNASAASDLGTCYFYEGNLEQANRYLQQATNLEPRLSEAYFNLSRALSEQYKFEESESALRSASALDADSVSGWIRNVDRGQIVLAAGGFAREVEIRGQLARQWREQESNSDLFALWRRTMSLPLALVFALPAILLYFIANKGGNRSRLVEKAWLPEPIETVRRIVMPGFVEAEEGHWGSALVAILVPVVLLAIPLWSRVTYGVPWFLAPPAVGLGYLPLVGFLAFVIVRAIRILRGSRLRRG